MLSPNPVWFSCSTGLGRTLAQHIASTHPSARLVATARDPSTLNYLPRRPTTVLTLALDVTSPSSIAAALTTTLTHFHRIDILINNAGTNVFGIAEAVPESAMRDIMETNFWGPMRLTREAVRIMRDENPRAAVDAASHGPQEEALVQGGTIVNVTSLGGRVAFPAHAAYHASKFALEGFSEAIATELDPAWGVRVLVLEPGGVKSEFAGKAARRAVLEHGAYGDEGLAVRRMLKGLMDEEGLQARCLEAGVVARAVVEVVMRSEGEGEGKGGLPLRLLVGRDAWEAVWGKEERARTEMLAWKGWSCGVGGGTIPTGE
ncbi:uncharacterized protein HMPREF1541_07780 [Cyphellophora europaea CBS 101466]|uniref:NAD(P)-binding protein n=1 Tax=Cyphellophora europaea (strain CBS 101466) TaxID=1220924 RepID=W2RNQ1_CYPE1|nr:uncharacterized protein HMPREF1541_07780 [Cyphellophora europaea CBS 101466]ETN38156.1 hypothetical protein HMPREF1541_07780 [Cyphellophora europaea CBS 101466]